MKLIHTLLLLIREENILGDISLFVKCLKSLEKSTYRTVVVYNQGCWDTQRTQKFLSYFDLDCIVIGKDENVGIVNGRQSCFQYIWNEYPETEFISELHLDMIFTHGWEDPLVDYLNTHDDPVIGCGIVDNNGDMAFVGKKVSLIPNDSSEADDYLLKLRSNLVLNGFTHPCIHKASILKEIGGYDTRFLTGQQAFEDDSALLGYFYYYGTKRNWRPKVCYGSVVYHAIGAQRLGINYGTWENFEGLVKQYGLMGLKHLSQMHASPWHIHFFSSEMDKRL